MKIEDIEGIGAKVLELLDQYHNPPHKELLLDSILFAYLSGRYSGVARQHYVYFYGTTKPHRIDFRFGGSNPAVLELAVRKPGGSGGLSGSPNQKELNKLCRVRRSQARMSALLLLDLAQEPLKKVSLKKSYEQLHAGPGKFERRSVRVIYVHRKIAYSFSWSPFKSK